MARRTIDNIYMRWIIVTVLISLSYVYGNEFEKFVHDRPQIIQAIMPDDDVWNWLDAKFKDTAGRPVYWISKYKPWQNGYTPTAYSFELSLMESTISRLTTARQTVRK